MPRDIPIGNGKMLIAYDKGGLLREFHFPLVGEENHAGEPFPFGIWAEGRIHWLPEGWEVRRDYLGDTLATLTEWQNDGLGLKITANDVIDFEENLYLRKLTVENFWDDARDIQLFLGHQFHILGNEIGNTAAFKPENRTLIHYKSDRYFLANAFANTKFGIDFFATGNRGTWKDAEDGHLSGNPIAQGSVDSVLGIPLTIPAKGKETCFYWIAAGTKEEEVQALNLRVKKETPEVFFRRTLDYWKLWVDKERLNFKLLPEKIGRLYRRSLLICRTQINNCGSIIAANDSDAIQFNRDTYSYMWPRDGALVAYALDLAGYETEPFYRFCAKILEKEGHFLHKYTPSGSLGSSWHPWLKGKLPIQGDETALVIWALWNHYQIFHDLEFIRSLYHSLIRKAADFMMNYRDLKTGLPLPSYDLWEERQGVLTFTASAVFGGLMAASHFAQEFGETSLAEEYKQGALRLRDAMEKHLYLPNEKRFARMLDLEGKLDPTIDASLYGLFAFGVYSAEKVRSTMDQVFERLNVNGGIIRYENDTYYRQNDQSNPWFVTTLWKAQYLIALAKTREELEWALPILDWVADHALESGVLAEQIHPQTGEPLSVSPLTWSHGAYIATVQEYLNKFIEIEKCPGCGMPKFSKNLS